MHASLYPVSSFIVIQRILPVIQLHCWGGLGSQLYAWAFRLDLEERFPHRRFVLVTHESGVSQRASELKAFFPDSVKCVQDFGIKSRDWANPEKNQKNEIKFKFRATLKKFLAKIGFLFSDENGIESIRIKPWTLQIRGHFSLLLIQPRFIDEIHSKIMLALDVKKGDNFKDKTVIHYRLGDLLKLDDKGPVNPERVLDVIKELQKDGESEILLFSDTPDIALDRLGKSSISIVPIEESRALETLMALSESKILIGTNSKLSVWASLFRSRKENLRLTYVPLEVQHHLHSNHTNLSNIIFY
jgi:hypothetical protein